MNKEESKSAHTSDESEEQWDENLEKLLSNLNLNDKKPVITDQPQLVAEFLQLLDTDDSDLEKKFLSGILSYKQWTDLKR